MGILSFIIWSANPEIFPNLNWFIVGNIRWYGLLFAMAFIVGQQIIIHIFKAENKPEQDIESLTIYIVVATVLGARLGHVFFYEPARFLSHPIEILKIWNGGLASHGAAIGILTGIWVYSNFYIRIAFSKPHFVFKKKKREGQSFLWVVDRIVIVVALGGCFIRTGNFINSEIIGKPTHSNYGVVFAWNIINEFENDRNVDDVKVEKRTINKDTAGTCPINITVRFQNKNYDENQLRTYIQKQFEYILLNYPDVKMQVNEPSDKPLDFDLKKNRDGSYSAILHTYGIPRHPTQLYEAFTSLLIFFLLFWLWSVQKEKVPEGKLFGLFLIILFGLRFFHEFLKENQVPFESKIPLNMGQWLSIPLVIIGIIILVRSLRNPNTRDLSK